MKYAVIFYAKDFQGNKALQTNYIDASGVREAYRLFKQNLRPSGIKGVKVRGILPAVKQSRHKQQSQIVPQAQPQPAQALG